MTRELAIKIIRGDTLGTSEQTHEAVKMAIEALKERKTSQLIMDGIGVRYCSNCRRIDDKYSIYER